MIDLWILAGRSYSPSVAPTKAGTYAVGEAMGTPLYLLVLSNVHHSVAP